jgi:trans-aconitate methyltransferase
MPIPFFRSAEAANRYEAYRPQVHAIFSDWLISAGLPGPYKHAIDIACGTGHSTAPLLRLSEKVDAIDTSPEMVSVARSKGLPARVAAYSSLPTRTYDLLSVCMAFHWFDREEAVKCLLAASLPGAVWLVSNFSLLGHESDLLFNEWYRKWYAGRFPAPTRAASAFRPTESERLLELVAEKSGVLRVQFDRQGLIGYLTTQSNVESRLVHEFGYADAERELDKHLPHVAEEGRFLYGYHYTICRARA